MPELIGTDARRQDLVTDQGGDRLCPKLSRAGSLAFPTSVATVASAATSTATSPAAAVEPKIGDADTGPAGPVDRSPTASPFAADPFAPPNPNDHRHKEHRNEYERDDPSESRFTHGRRLRPTARNNEDLDRRPTTPHRHGTRPGARRHRGGAPARGAGTMARSGRRQLRASAARTTHT